MKKENLFVVNELLPVGLAFLSGQPYAGRTWLSLYLALQVSNGRSFFDEYMTKQGKVLYFADESEEDRIAFRLKELTGAMLPQTSEHGSNLQFCFVGQQSNRLRALELPQLVDYLKELTHDFRLIIVDSFSLSSVFALVTRTQKKDAIMKLLELRDEAKQTGATVFFVISTYKPCEQLFEYSLSTAWKLVRKTRFTTGKRTLTVHPLIPGEFYNTMKFSFVMKDLMKGFVDTEKPRRVW